MSSMKIKLLGIVVVVVLAFTIAVGSVGAQEGRHGRQDRFGRIEVGQGLIRIVADETGLTVSEVSQEFRAGSSLAEIITANDGSVEDVTTVAVEQTTERINEAAALGRITEARAEQMLANLATRITEVLNFNPEQRQNQRAILMRVMGETGLTMRQIVNEWRGGSTLGEILTAQDEDVQAFIDETLTLAEARLTRQVESGNMTQAQADERLASLREFVPEFLNQPFPVGLSPDEPISVA